MKKFLSFLLIVTVFSFSSALASSDVGDITEIISYDEIVTVETMFVTDFKSVDCFAEDIGSLTLSLYKSMSEKEFVNILFPIIENIEKSPDLEFLGIPLFATNTILKFDTGVLEHYYESSYLSYKKIIRME